MENQTTRAAPLAGGPGDAGIADEAPPIPWDTNEYRAMVCRTCGVPRVFRRRRMNHSFHFMLALGTLGLWLPVWGIAIIHQSMRAWTCIFCGVQQRRK